MIKILLVFGTRPEAIKMAPIIAAARKRKDIQLQVCVTGQHRQMLDQVLDILEIKPDYDLSIMKEKQDLFDITSNVLLSIKPVLDKAEPDIVLVHGDTSTTFAAALGCFYKQIAVGHVEAGLRTYNLKSPFPEEFNRQAVGVFADYHFAPTEGAKENLINEGKEATRIYVTGNTAIDALKLTVTDQFVHPILQWVGDDKLILITAHRRENLGQPMEQMFRAIKRVVNENNNIKVLYPIHLNPVVRETADRILGNDQRIKLIEPLDVIDFHNLMARSYIILTDSGGIQEEAPSLGVPVLVMRDTTERPEGIKAGTLKLVGTTEEVIYSNFTELLNNRSLYEKMSKASNPYGDGLASERILDIITEHYRKS